MGKYKRFIALLVAVLLFASSFDFVSAAQETPIASAESAVRVQEIESLRTTNSETYLLSDGTYQCVIYGGDKYYEASDGKLLQIDNSIVMADASAKASLLTSASNAAYKNAGNRFDVYLSAQGSPNVALTYKDYGISFSPVSAASRGGVFAAANSAISVGQVQLTALSQLTETGNNTARYANAFPNTDLVYVLEDNILKEYIVLNNSSAPNTFTFRYQLDGVAVNQNSKNPQFVNENNEVVFSLLDLFAVDANGATTDALSYDVKQIAGSTDVMITVALDESFMSDRERVYPIIIDPSSEVISSSSTADTCVCEGQRYTNFYLESLRTGCDTTYGNRRSFIKFVIPTRLFTKNVITAVLELEKVSGSAPVVYAYPSIGAWTSSTLTWDNMPEYNGAYKSTKSIVQSDGVWYSMYVTNIVQAWLNYTIPHYGFVVRSGIEDNTSIWTTFYSSDATESHRPVLTINYSE